MYSYTIMHHTSGFQLLIVWGYLCKLRYVYILTYCPKPTTSIILSTTIFFLNSLYELPSCTKTQNSLIQLLALRLNQPPIASGIIFIYIIIMFNIHRYKAVVCIYLYIHIFMNTTILQLVVIYNIQLHVSALYVGNHQVVQRTY